MTWQLEEAIAYYRKQGAPGDQSALIALLGEIQRENGGGIPVAAVEEAAKAYGVKESLLLALIPLQSGGILGLLPVPGLIVGE